MGVYLPKPVTQKESETGGSLESDTKYGVSCMQGWRDDMEDAHVAVPEVHGKLGVYGVFDGHGGAVVSAWVAKHFETVFAEQVEKLQAAKDQFKPVSEIPVDVAIVAEALEQTFLTLDQQLASGSEAQELASLLEEAKKKKQENSDGSEKPIPRQQLMDMLRGGMRIVEQDGQTYIKLRSDPMEEDETEGRNVTIEDLDEETAEEPSSRAAMKATPANTVEEADPLAQTQKAAIQGANGDDGLVGSRVCSPEHVGCTAVVAVVVGTKENPYLVVANAGDSRAVLSRDGEAIAMSEDHKPNNPIESQRIWKAGGTVVGGRVDGNLNLSRAIGDLVYKSDKHLTAREQKISVFPDVRVIPLTSKDEFVIVACDGIWDAMKNQEAITYIRDKIQATDEPDLGKICEDVCDFCISDNPLETEGIGGDNMTCMIVQIAPRLRSLPSEGGATAKLYREEGQ